MKSPLHRVKTIIYPKKKKVEPHDEAYQCSDDSPSGFRVHFHENGKKNAVLSDWEVQDCLHMIAIMLDRRVHVTSADRDHALTVGAGAKSLHLQHRAADFHVEGLLDSAAFQLIQDCAKDIFDPREAYELLLHGPYTETHGHHIHLGRYGKHKRAGVYVKTEGLTPATRKDYRLIRIIQIPGFEKAA